MSVAAIDSKPVPVHCSTCPITKIVRGIPDITVDPILLQHLGNLPTRSVDLAAERAKRAARLPKWRLSRRGNPYMTVDGYHIVVFKRRRSWAFRIELIGTEREWYSELRCLTEDAARSNALLAVRQLGQAPLNSHD